MADLTFNPRTTPDTHPRRKRVVVLSGGTSSEREISLQSGVNVANALRQAGNEVEMLDTVDASLETTDFSAYDVAFIALHGQFGEDGQLQALLEERDIPYTGSRPTPSRIGMSKSASKERFILAGLPTPEYAIIYKTDCIERLHGVARKIGYPLVVKPNSQGSSLGVSIVYHPSELPLALANCFSFDDFGLIEQFISGEEWTVGLLDQTILPPMRIETENAFFDYAAKYTDEQTLHNLNPDVPEETVTHIGEIALRAAMAIGTSGLVRVDLRVDSQGRPWLLEVNTVPGLTTHSLVPLAAAFLGWNMPELCERAIASAMAMHASRVPQRLSA